MAAASAVKPGIKGGLYRNTGTYGSPTWTEVGLVREATVSMPWDMSEAGARQTNSKLYGKTRVDPGITFDLRADDADTAYIAIFAAAVSQSTQLDLMALDGKITVEGAMGVRGKWIINQTGQAQPIDANIYTPFEAKPAWSSDGYPTSVIMGAASTPAFTAF